MADSAVFSRTQELVDAITKNILDALDRTKQFPTPQMMLPIELNTTTDTTENDQKSKGAFEWDGPEDSDEEIE